MKTFCRFFSVSMLFFSSFAGVAFAEETANVQNDKDQTKPSSNHLSPLLPENPAYQPIDGTNAVIHGKVRAVLRTY